MVATSNMEADTSGEAGSTPVKNRQAKALYEREQGYEIKMKHQDNRIDELIIEKKKIEDGAKEFQVEGAKLKHELLMTEN